MLKKLRRWIFWSLTTLFLLLLVAAVGIRFYARAEHLDALLRARILSAVNESLNGKVQFEKLSGSLWDGLSFHGVSVSEQENMILSAPVVTAEFGLLEQIYAFFSSSKIRIGHLKITNPKLPDPEMPRASFHSNTPPACSVSSTVAPNWYAPTKAS